MARKLNKSELIEIIIPKGSTTSKFQLPDIPNLRNVHLTNIEIYTEHIIPKSILSGNALISEALMKSCFLTLQAYNGKNFMWQKPFFAFVNMFDGVSFFTWFPTMFVGQKVNYPKSYFEIADIALIPADVDTSVLIDISYCEVAAVANKDKKAGFRNQS